LALDISQAFIAHFEHVGIIPVTRTGVGFESILFVQDDSETHATPIDVAVPAVLNVGGGAPEVSDVLRPLPGLALAPLANAEHNGTTRLIESIAYQGVGGFRILGAGTAPVVFQVVDAPGCIGAGILKFVSAAAGSALAGGCARIGSKYRISGPWNGCIRPALSCRWEICPDRL